MNVYKATVNYGRGEMTLKVLVSADNKIEAKRVAMEAAPVSCHKDDVVCWTVPDLVYTGKTPQVICKL